MKKVYTLFLSFFLSSMLPLGLNAAPFEVYEDFDDDSHFTESSSVPDGWKSEGTVPFSRMEGGAYTIGFEAYNGSYVFYTASSNESPRTEVIYTSMMKLAAGQPCTIEFQVYAPGNGMRKNGFVVKAGTAQNADAQTISVKTLDLGNYAEWTPVKGTFIPEEEGEYCFSIALQTNLTQALWVGIDDVIISGTAPDEEVPDQPIVLEPNPENLSECIDLPYLEYFDGENYDGESYLPVKWLSVGDVPWITMGLTDLPAVSGDYFMFAPETGLADQMRRAYTPFFLLTAGTEYTVSFYLHMEAGSATGNKSTLKFSVGTEQDGDFHNNLLALEEYATTESWEQKTVAFTPTATGAYCFAFALSNEASYSGFVCVDNFQVTAPGLISRVAPNFTIPSLSNLNDGSVLAFHETPISLVNLSEYADSYLWEIDGGAELSDATAENPQVTFKKSGTYTITLTAKNARGERSTTKTADVMFVNEDQTNFPVLVNNQNEDGSPLTKGMIPAFDTNEVDYVSGPNHYYRKYAERVDLPEGYKFSLNIMNFFLTNLNYVAVTASGDYVDQRTCAVSIVVYGAKEDGSLDEANVLGRVDSTTGDMFGTTGIGTYWGEPCGYNFTTPVELEGTVYVAFEFDENFIIDAFDENLGRSVVSLAVNKHKSKITTLYAKPYSVPEGAVAKADGNWYPISDIDSSMNGLGLYLVLWVDATVPEDIPEIPDTPDTPDDGSVAINSAGEIVFAVRMDGGNLLVSGTKAGETVSVYSANGALVASATGTEGCTVIPMAHLGKGLYVAKTSEGARKFIK